MTQIITVTAPIEKIFGFDAPPAEHRDGVVIAEDQHCPNCKQHSAVLERAHIGGLGTIHRLVCPCPYWEWRMKGGEDGTA